MGLNDLLVEINYLTERINEAVKILIPVNNYLLKVGQNLNENAGIDLFEPEDALNREFSIDLFVVPLEDKAAFLLNQAKIKEITSQLTEDINKLQG